MLFKEEPNVPLIPNIIKFLCYFGTNNKLLFKISERAIKNLFENITLSDILLYV